MAASAICHCNGGKNNMILDAYDSDVQIDIIDLSMTRVAFVYSSES